MIFPIQQLLEGVFDADANRGCFSQESISRNLDSITETLDTNGGNYTRIWIDLQHMKMLLWYYSIYVEYGARLRSLLLTDNLTAKRWSHHPITDELTETSLS